MRCSSINCTMTTFVVAATRALLVSTLNLSRARTASSIERKTDGQVQRSCLRCRPRSNQRRLTRTAPGSTCLRCCTYLRNAKVSNCFYKENKIFGHETTDNFLRKIVEKTDLSCVFLVSVAPQAIKIRRPSVCSWEAAWWIGWFLINRHKTRLMQTKNDLKANSAKNRATWPASFSLSSRQQSVKFSARDFCTGWLVPRFA